jgi:hypothetical protein
MENMQINKSGFYMLSHLLENENPKKEIYIADNLEVSIFDDL